MIRPIEATDRADWLRMRRELWPTEEGPAEGIADFFAGQDTLLRAVFVHERDDGQATSVGGAKRPALLGGFIEIGERTNAEGCGTSPVPFIEGWYVDADLRMTGVGKALVREAEAWVRRKGYTEMGSDLLIDNEISLKAHQALGYHEVERLIAMAKKL